MIVDKREEAIILEDDAMLHNDFMNKYQQCRQNIAESAISHNSPFTILLLFYNIADINESQREWVGINPEKRNVFKMQSKNMDSAVGYVISRQHAAQCLINYDKPFIEYDITNKYNITSEYIIRFTDGLLLHPVLAIEEPMVTSNLRDNAIYGEKASQHLDWNEYTAAETNSWRLLLEGRKHHVAYNHQKAYEVMKDIRLDELSSYHQYIYIDIALTSFWYANQREKVKELVYILRNLYKNDIVIRKNMDANYTRIMNNVKFYVPEIEF
jgi:GR25 family glycosyltransferase involved in LPS biosynthesis